MSALGQTVVDIPKALSLKAAGASYEDLGKMFGTHKSNIHKVLSRNYPDLDIEKFCEFHKAPDAHLEVHLFQLISKIDDPLRVKMLERRGYTDPAILVDKIRLLRGQSTSINEVVPTQVINVIQARLEISSSSNLTPKDQVIDITPDKQNT